MIFLTKKFKIFGINHLVLFPLLLRDHCRHRQRLLQELKRLDFIRHIGCSMLLNRKFKVLPFLIAQLLKYSIFNFFNLPYLQPI